ncbi:uncharacterized protein BYT42DRAFT_377549 [Radiomyces spectabilis]|uniref:uncharacterized protein n=1 Tax=Radiomyces spectabilis TaxID=64574 RepID=UPI0022205B56|nr:uncharacterized protein BYT42DRAFT_377549 [Radiomyces spectabilis]KAI8376182.1 hypothetical protein BYT42DRAFT_377549 [Radiomyces spectabilis]
MRQTRSTAAHSPNARHPKTRSSARNSKPPPTPKKPARKPSNTTQTSNSQFTVRRSQRHKSSPSPKPVATVIKKNNDYCDTCGGTGRFICCDACPKAFHFSCVEPPMEADQVAEMKDPWFCNECLHRQSNQSISAPQGLFHCLFEDLETKNPKAFQLPFHIRNFFEGVSINKLGGYVDNTIVKPVKYKNGQPLLPDYHQLKDQHGNFILCYACRKTALEKPIIACDYCPLYWHMDCLNPPMPAPPNIAKKWMCPNHVEHALPRRRKRKRPRTVECTCAHHAHDGDIDIIDGSDNEEDGSRATRDVPGHGVTPTVFFSIILFSKHDS